MSFKRGNLKIILKNEEYNFLSLDLLNVIVLYVSLEDLPFLVPELVEGWEHLGTPRLKSNSENHGAL